MHQHRQSPGKPIECLAGALTRCSKFLCSSQQFANNLHWVRKMPAAGYCSHFVMSDIGDLISSGLTDLCPAELAPWTYGRIEPRHRGRDPSDRVSGPSTRPRGQIRSEGSRSSLSARSEFWCKCRWTAPISATQISSCDQSVAWVRRAQQYWSASIEITSNWPTYFWQRGCPDHRRWTFLGLGARCSVKDEVVRPTEAYVLICSVLLWELQQMRSKFVILLEADCHLRENI